MVASLLTNEVGKREWAQHELRDHHYKSRHLHVRSIHSLIMQADSVKEKIVDELHRPARRNYPRRRVILKGIDDLWQGDLLELQPHSSDNRGYKFILIVIDCLSKYVWWAPLKSKSAKDVTQGFREIFQKAHPRRPRHLQTDKGKEFYNSQMRALLQEFTINHYSTESHLKASIVERVIRTLKTWLWKLFGKQGNYKWIDIFDREIVNKYNRKRHRSIGMTPLEVKGKRKETQALKTLYKDAKTQAMKKKRLPKYKVGDFVRISKMKGDFEKGYTPSWSTEIFKIHRVKRTVPPTYLLQDSNNQDVKGGFYEEELQLTRFPHVYLVEKILRRRGNRAYVKWLGFDSQYNSWITVDNNCSTQRASEEEETV